MNSQRILLWASLPLFYTICTPLAIKPFPECYDVIKVTPTDEYKMVYDEAKTDLKAAGVPYNFLDLRSEFLRKGPNPLLILGRAIRVVLGICTESPGAILHHVTLLNGSELIISPWNPKF